MLKTKEIVQNGCVISFFLYGNECWTDERKIYHNRDVFLQENDEYDMDRAVKQQGGFK